MSGSLGENWPKFERGFRALIGKLRDIPHVERIVIVGPIADLSAKLPSAIFVRDFGLASLALDVPTEMFMARNAKIMQLLAATEGGKITVVWPHKALCDGEWCRTVRNDELLYFDDNHLSLAGARLVAPLLSVVFETND